MNCGKCSAKFPTPDIVENMAYFVCIECGHLHEEKDYKEYTKEERLAQFEQLFGMKVPLEYLEFAGKHCGMVVLLPPPIDEATEFYFGDGTYEIGFCCGVEPFEDNTTIFDNDFYIDTLDLPQKLVLLEGDGHTWLALDYRESKNEPKVIVTESEESSCLVVAESFKAFAEALKPYESIYDLDGERID